jgi:hypothetical protein
VGPDRVVCRVLRVPNLAVDLDPRLRPVTGVLEDHHRGVSTWQRRPLALCPLSSSVASRAGSSPTVSRRQSAKILT